MSNVAILALAVTVYASLAIVVGYALARLDTQP